MTGTHRYPVEGSRLWLICATIDLFSITVFGVALYAFLLPYYPGVGYLLLPDILLNGSWAYGVLLVAFIGLFVAHINLVRSLTRWWLRGLASLWLVPIGVCVLIFGLLTIDPNATRPFPTLTDGAVASGNVSYRIVVTHAGSYDPIDSFWLYECDAAWVLCRDLGYGKVFGSDGRATIEQNGQVADVIVDGSSLFRFDGTQWACLSSTSMERYCDGFRGALR